VHRFLGACCAFTGSLIAGPPIKWNEEDLASMLATLPSMLKDDMKDLAEDIDPVAPGVSNFKLIPLILLLLLNISACIFCCWC
jgi:hypothetical protein